MKGVVFTEFLEMVESSFSPLVADRIIEQSELPSGGAYTAIGTYDHDEMVSLVSQLSSETGTPVPELLQGFGGYLFGRFVAGYPMFFEGQSSAFDFLATVHNHIHTEVRKLYADAELPSLEHERPEPNRMVMDYRSSRGPADLAEGLIRACIEHFKETIAVSREDLSDGQNTHVRFVLEQQG